VQITIATNQPLTLEPRIWTGPNILWLLPPNQTAFIRGRRIHDNFCTVQLTCRWLHACRVPCVLLKVDIAKAFDYVAWPFLLEVLQHVGFPQRWRDWVPAMLSSASTKIMVNGRVSWRICHARGLHQGDPLSPMLFVIIMEVLNALILVADHAGQFTPLPGDRIKPFRRGFDALVLLTSCCGRSGMGVSSRVQRPTLRTWLLPSTLRATSGSKPDSEPCRACWPWWPPEAPAPCFWVAHSVKM
jgi:hypothetical protein